MRNLVSYWMKLVQRWFPWAEGWVVELGHDPSHPPHEGGSVGKGPATPATRPWLLPSGCRRTQLFNDIFFSCSQLALFFNFYFIFIIFFSQLSTVNLTCSLKGLSLLENHVSVCRLQVWNHCIFLFRCICFSACKDSVWAGDWLANERTLPDESEANFLFWQQWE